MRNVICTLAAFCLIAPAAFAQPGQVSCIQMPALTGLITSTVNTCATTLPLVSGNILVGSSGGNAASVAMSGDATITNAGVITVTKTGGVALGTMATQNASAVAITGGTINGTVIGGTTAANINGVAVIARNFGFSGNITSPFWGTNGLGLQGNAATYTDNSSTGTITTEALLAFPGNTLAATNAITVTNLSTLYLPAPIAGTNVTATNLWSLQAAGQVLANSNLFVKGTFVPADSSTWGIGGLNASIVTVNGTFTTNNVSNIDVNAGTNTANIGTGTTTGTVTFGGGANIITVASPLNLSGAISRASQTTNGYGLTGSASTFTDTTGTGTIAVQGLYAFPASTLASTSAQTVTNLGTVYIPAPVAGTNVTAGTLSSLITGGAVRVGANLVVVGTSNLGPTNIQVSNGSGLTNIGTGTTSGAVTIGGASNTTDLASATTNLTAVAASKTVCTDGSQNLVACTGITPVLSGTTGSIGGGALIAGACTSGTATISGATTSMDIHATPQTYPGDGAIWEAYVSGINTVTVKVCALIAVTPGASFYNVRVNQ
jgi:hypothetical protein